MLSEIRSFAPSIYSLKSQDAVTLARNSQNCSIIGEGNNWIKVGQNCKNISVSLNKGDTLVIGDNCSEIDVIKSHEECEISIRSNCRNIFINGKNQRS